MPYRASQDTQFIGAFGELTAAEELRVQELQALSDTAADEALGKLSGSVVKKEITEGGNYTLPTATDSILGGVKVGTGLEIAEGVLSADKQLATVYEVNTLQDFIDVLEDTTNTFKIILNPFYLTVSNNLSIEAAGFTYFMHSAGLLFSGDYNITLTSAEYSSPQINFYGGLSFVGQSVLRNITISASNACEAYINTTSFTASRAAVTATISAGYLMGLYYEKLTANIGGSLTGGTQSFWDNTTPISQTNATDLTDGGATTLHKHSYNNLDDKPTIPTLPVKASGAEVDTGEDDAKFVTPKAMEDSSYIKSLSGLNQTKAWTLIDPKGAYGKDHEIFVWKTDAAITITKIEVSCDADPATEITGDLKWADAFIGFGNATVINDFDTTAGVRSDTSITAGAVGAGKCIYISFDAEPLEAITQINFSITYDND